MDKQQPDPSRIPSGHSLPMRLLRGLGWLLKQFALHILGHFVIGLLIGIALWLFGGFSLPEALIAGMAIMLALLLIGAATY